MTITPITTAQAERELFTARLRHALESAGYSGHSQTKLMREFNARTDKPITSCCARKWLMGEAIPTQERVQILADWLGVNAAYLRFGIKGEIGPEDARLLDNLAKLPHNKQAVFREMVAVMARQPVELAAA